MTLLPLKIDVDTPDGRLSWPELVARAGRANVTITRVEDTRSPSGRGWHRRLWVHPAPTTAVEVVALQLLFGSDAYREAYCLNRARQVDAGTVPPSFRALNHWNVLYGPVV